MTEAIFKDHFSVQSRAYAAGRPHYPDALFDAIATVAPRPCRAWEPGCGSGQATRGLAARFEHVHATDASAAQLAHHWAQDPARAGNVTLAVEAAEHTVLPDRSVGVVAVAQALHWFERDAFFAECERVLVPGGVLATWGYGDFDVPPGMDDAVSAFRADIALHWPPDRTDVDTRYKRFPMPFEALPVPRLDLQAQLSLDAFLDYLRSSSATVRCLRATGVDPVEMHRPALAAAWGDAALRELSWPLFGHLRRKPMETH